MSSKYVTASTVKTTKPRIRLPEAKLRFSPKAWYKILYMRESVDTEVSGFGISSIADPLFVEDFVLIKQVSSVASTDMNDDAVAEYMEEMADNGYQPAECMRIWIHTHPCNSANPSLTDEDTFMRVFGNCNWAVMFIMAHGGINTAHLMMNSGVRSVFRIPTDIDHKAVSVEEWDDEVLDNVEKYVPPVTVTQNNIKQLYGNASPYLYDSKMYGKYAKPVEGIHGRYDCGYGFDELMDDEWEDMLTEETVSEKTEKFSDLSEEFYEEEV